jgi:predicted O-linked N-acetylglucosamine transferase (SPINDLY family)
VQLTWLGYANTTGLPTVDYRITDEEADPPGTTEALHSETLLRVPGCFLCFRPPEDAPPPGPAQVERPITFGSFNQRQKIGPAVVALWSRVLKAVPGSRLLLKTRGIQDHGAAAALLAQFEAGDIDPARVTVLGRLQDVENHLARYHDIDIALDTFPYAGTTTTCDTLWMGVPVVTLAGATHVSRVGVSLLKAVGLAELVARDADDYVRIAAELAADRDRLAALRQGLRERMARSPLVDAAGYARRFQALLESAWRQRRAAAG